MLFSAANTNADLVMRPLLNNPNWKGDREFLGCIKSSLVGYGKSLEKQFIVSILKL